MRVLKQSKGDSSIFHIENVIKQYRNHIQPPCIHRRITIKTISQISNLRYRQHPIPSPIDTSTPKHRRQVNLLQKGNADGPPYELRNAGIIIIIFLAQVCRASSIIYV